MPVWRSVRLWALILTVLASLAASRARAEESAAEQRLRKDVTYLASDECEGRGVLTPGNRLAGDYLANELKKAGVKPGGKDGSYFQPFTIAGATLEGTPRVVLTGPDGEEIVLKRGTQFEPLGVGGSAELKATPVVFAGYGMTKSWAPKDGERVTYNDYDGLDVTGKVVVVLQGTPRLSNKDTPFGGTTQLPFADRLLRHKMTNAQERGAAGLLLVNDRATAADGDDLMIFSQTAVDKSTATIPAFQVARSVLEQLLGGGREDGLGEREHLIDRDLKPRSTATKWKASLELKMKRTIDARNVVGVVEGTGPLAQETIVLGAHYDHWGYGGHGSGARRGKPTYGKPVIHHGADDNGSGTTVVLDLARRFAALPERKGRRLVFLFFSGEELGLLGSLHYCKEPLFPLDSTVAMVNLDMVGRLRHDKDSDKDRLIVYGADTAKEFDELLDDVNRKYDFKFAKQGRGSGVWEASDHASFHAKKMPVLFFFTGDHPDYHKPSDTADKVNVAGMARIADLTQDVVARLAAAPSRPQFVPPPKQTAGSEGPRIGIAPASDDGKDGVLIATVQDEGPADKAGMKKGDRIVSVADQPVKNFDAFVPLLRTLKAGEPVEFGLVRDGKRLAVKVTPEARKVIPRLSIRFDYGDDKDGVLVESVTEGGPADLAGIKDGDRIVVMDGKPILNIEDYMNVLGEHKRGAPVEVTVLRANKKVEVKVRLE